MTELSSDSCYEYFHVITFSSARTDDLMTTFNYLSHNIMSKLASHTCNKYSYFKTLPINRLLIPLLLRAFYLLPILIHLSVVALIRSRCNSIHPLFIFEIPVDGLHDSDLKRSLRIPAKVCLNL